MVTVGGGAAPLARLRLRRQRRAAAWYVAAGWPVVAGACWVGHRYWCGVPWCTVTGLHPACRDAAAAVENRDPLAALAAGGRGGFPSSVLLVTGLAVDVLELPAGALHAAAAAAGWGVPVARLPEGRWLLFAGSGPVDPGVWPAGATRLEEPFLHGEGEDSLVALPPSVLRHGQVRWRTRPRLVVGDLLPAAELVGRVLPLLRSCGVALPSGVPASGARPAGGHR